MSLNITSIDKSISPQIGQEASKIQDMMDNIDVTDPTAMIKMQMEYSRYTMEVGMMTATIKDVKDAVNQVLQRI